MSPLVPSSVASLAARYAAIVVARDVFSVAESNVSSFAASFAANVVAHVFIILVAKVLSTFVCSVVANLKFSPMLRPMLPTVTALLS